MNVRLANPWRVSLPKGTVLRASDKNMLLKSAWRLHTCKCDFSHLISVEASCLLVVGPSPFVEKPSRGWPIVHSFHKWNFFHGAKIGGSGTLDYPLRAEKKFEFFFFQLTHQWTKSHMERMYDWEPPKEPPCQRRWSYDQRTQSFYWNKAFSPLHGKKKPRQWVALKFSFFFFLADTFWKKQLQARSPLAFLRISKRKTAKKEKKEKEKEKKGGGLVFEPH